MAIYIIRHGETAGNAKRFVQFPDTALNDRGLAQAEKVAARLAGVGLSRIISSDYARAHTTALAIQKACDAPLEIHHGLRERNFGDFRGRPHDEVGDLYAEDLEPANGESWPQFHARVAEAWQALAPLAATMDGHLALVSHGLVCYSLALHQLQLPAGESATYALGNTAVTIVEPHPPWQVLRYNCCEHLDSPALTPAGKSGYI